MEFSNLNKVFAQEYYAVPDYQRDYEWGAAQNSTLFEDILSMIKDSNETDHFIGAIVTIPYEEDTGVNKSISLKDYSIEEQNVKHIVDGQQRLTSISILMQAILDCISKDTELSQKQKDRLDKFSNLLRGNDYNYKDDRAPKLILNGNTGSYYNSKVLGVNDEPSSLLYRGAKRIKGAYDLFEKSISEAKSEYVSEGICANTYDFYKKLGDIITKKVILVEIVCGKSSNAFQVFDSLNGKGLDLTAADRIKNIFLSWSPSGKGAQKWDAFVAAVGEEYLTNFFVSLFFASKGKRISKNKLPDTFKEMYKDSALADFDYFFNDIRAKGSMYGSLRNSMTSSKKVNELLNDIKRLNSDQVFVLLFAATSKYGEAIIDTKDYVDFVKSLINLIVRMQVCEKSTNKLDAIFSRCVNLINSGSASLNVITKKIKDEMTSIAGDSEFKVSFERFAPSDSRIGEYYLRTLENYERKKNGDRLKVEPGLTVEHIIPKTLDDLSEWYGKTPVPEDVKADFKNSVVERLGNKVLLYGDDNTSASNNCYSKKLGVYQSGKRGQDQGTPVGTFMLVKELVNDYPVQFNHDEVNDRARHLADMAVDIWK